MTHLSTEEKISILVEAQKYMNSKENYKRIKDSMCFSIQRILTDKFKITVISYDLYHYIPEFSIDNVIALSEKYNFKKPATTEEQYGGYWWCTFKKFDKINRNKCFDALITELSK